MFWSLNLNRLFFVVIFLIQYLSAVGSVIVLNGTSSSGKTSISKCLQQQLVGNWVIISIDDFVVSATEQVAYELKIINFDMTLQETNNVIASNIKKIISIIDAAQTAITWSSIKAAMYQEVNALIQADYNVIIDTVFSDYEYDINSLYQQILNVNKHYVVLVYCCPEKLIEHVIHRNATGDYTQRRDVTRCIESFCELYGPTLCQQTRIDSLHAQSVSNIVKSFADQEQFCSFHSICPIKINTLLIQKFELVSNSSVGITPIRGNYNIVVNTGDMSSFECANKIKQLID